MKKKTSIITITGVLLALSLTGCGDGSETNRPEVPPSTEATAEPASQQAESRNEISDYEQKYATGEFTVEDYKTLASLYMEAGYIKKQRDMLEQCWRLFSDQDAFNELQNVTVNLAEEEEQIQQMASQLAQNLSIPEYVNEGVAQLISPEWLETMMPKLKEGKRTYYQEAENGSSKLTLQVGYDETGQANSQVWYTTGEKQVTWISQTPDSVQLMTTTLADGKYDGAYDSWLVIASTSDVYHENGTFDKGICVGDYTADVRFGSADTDLFALWGTREDMDFTTYTGNFGTDGITTLTQPSGSSKVTNGGNGEDKYIVYAYDAGKTHFLFVNEAETEASAYVFSASALGMKESPVYTPYEPKADSSAASGEGEKVSLDTGEVKVRIYDGNIEWFDGKKWHTAGSAAQYAQEDPFRSYGGNQTPENGEGTEGGENSGQGTGQTTVKSNRGGGSIAKETPKSNTNTNKPAKTPGKSTQTPATTPSSETPSTTPENNGGGDNGGGNSGGGDNGGGNSGGGDNGGGNEGGDNGSTPTPTPTPEPGGNETDIEWTPDAL